MVENGNGYRIMPPELEELYCCRHNKDCTIARFALKYINIGYYSSLYLLDMIDKCSLMLVKRAWQRDTLFSYLYLACFKEITL